MSSRNAFLFNTVIFLFFISFVTAGWAAEESSFVYNDKGQRDPFWPLVGPSGLIITYDTDFLITDLILEGTMSAEGGGIAIINGKVLRQNDNIGQFIVQQIDTNSVTLTKDGKKFVLKLKKEE